MYSEFIYLKINSKFTAHHSLQNFINTYVFDLTMTNIYVYMSILLYHGLIYH